MTKSHKYLITFSVLKNIFQVKFMELFRRKYGIYTYESERKAQIEFNVKFRPTVVAKHLQACSGHPAQTAGTVDQNASFSDIFAGNG